jgi:hypothetical protein
VLPRDVLRGFPPEARGVDGLRRRRGLAEELGGVDGVEDDVGGEVAAGVAEVEARARLVFEGVELDALGRMTRPSVLGSVT